MIVAIDGPAASGKSTIAKLLAEKLSYLYIDTGAMYRVVTLLILEAKYSDLDYSQNLELLDKDSDIASQILGKLDIQLKAGQVFNGTRDLSSAIRSPLVSSNVAQVAAMPLVREYLVAEQRKLGQRVNCVMDGRDIGTVVFPQAELKIFLTASAETRARRRLKDFLAQGLEIDLDVLIEDIKARDRRDSERAVSPLRCAEDAIEISSDNMTVDEVLQRILDLLANIK